MQPKDVEDTTARDSRHHPPEQTIGNIHSSPAPVATRMHFQRPACQLPGLAATGLELLPMSIPSKPAPPPLTLSAIHFICPTLRTYMFIPKLATLVYPYWAGTRASGSRLRNPEYESFPAVSNLGQLFSLYIALVHSAVPMSTLLQTVVDTSLRTVFAH